MIASNRNDRQRVFRQTPTVLQLRGHAFQPG